MVSISALDDRLGKPVHIFGANEAERRNGLVDKRAHFDFRHSLTKNRHVSASRPPTTSPSQPRSAEEEAGDHGGDHKIGPRGARPGYKASRNHDGNIAKGVVAGESPDGAQVGIAFTVRE